MKKDRIARLRDRYLSAKKEHKEPYFDADEIDDLLSSLEEDADYPMYEEVLKLGLRLHPGNTNLLIRQCRQYMVEGEEDKALSLIRQIGEKGNQELDLVEIECYANMGNYPKVMQLTEDLIASKADYLSIVFEYIAPVLNDLTMYAEAIDYIEKGLRLFPDNFILNEELCFALESTEDYGRAIILCNHLIDKKPYSFDLWFALGRLYAYRQEYPKAIEAFDFALTCDDSVVELKLLLVYCLNKNENYQRAIEICKDILSDPLYTDKTATLMADCYLKMGNHQPAYDLLKATMAEYISHPPFAIYIQLIACCVEMERLEEAYSLLMEVNSRYPDNPEVLIALSYISTYTDDGEQDVFYSEIEKIMENMLEYDDLCGLKAEVTPSLPAKTGSQPDGPKSLTRFLAKEYIKNKDNRN